MVWHRKNKDAQWSDITLCNLLSLWSPSDQSCDINFEPGSKMIWYWEMGWKRNKSEDLQVSLVTWRTSIIKSTPEVLLAIARARRCGVHSQALKGWPPPLSHRGNGKRPFAASGRWDEIVRFWSPKRWHETANADDWQSFQQFKGSKKTHQFWCSSDPSSWKRNWLTNLPIYRIYHTRIRLFATALLKKQSNAMSSGFRPILC